MEKITKQEILWIIELIAKDLEKNEKIDHPLAKLRTENMYALYKTLWRIAHGDKKRVEIK